MAGKLTTAQREFLGLLVKGPHPADRSYKPASRLVVLGYATREIRNTKMRLHVFTITDAGRAALSQEGGQNG